MQRLTLFEVGLFLSAIMMFVLLSDISLAFTVKGERYSDPVSCSKYQAGDKPSSSLLHVVKTVLTLSLKTFNLLSLSY
jgi:hypothetical protein